MKKSNLLMSLAAIGIIAMSCEKENLTPLDQDTNSTTNNTEKSFSPADLCDISEEFGDSNQFYIPSGNNPEYGETVYANKDEKIKFRYKFVDYGNQANLNPEYRVGNAMMVINSEINKENNNFDYGFCHVSNADLEIDLSNIDYSQKIVSFDLSNLLTVSNANEFQVNNGDLSALPAGVTMNLINLGTAGNGDDCFKVELSGPINTLIIRGNGKYGRTALDNLCIREI